MVPNTKCESKLMFLMNDHCYRDISLDCSTNNEQDEGRINPRKHILRPEK